MCIIENFVKTQFQNHRQKKDQVRYITVTVRLVQSGHLGKIEANFT